MEKVDLLVWCDVFEIIVFGVPVYPSPNIELLVGGDNLLSNHGNQHLTLPIPCMDILSWHVYKGSTNNQKTHAGKYRIALQYSKPFVLKSVFKNDTVPDYFGRVRLRVDFKHRTSPIVGWSL